MSQKEDRPGTKLTGKIERLISEAKKAKTDTAESKAPAKEAEIGGEGPGLERKLKEEILTTLTETSKELSRIIGILHDEVDASSTEQQILPQYCSYCGRDLLPNALYCDRCGASVRGAQ